MKIFIMSGLPGSGKSTWAKANAQLVLSADDYFIEVGGVYRFDPKKLPQAHDECLGRFLKAVANSSAESLAVDNTNISAWEIAPYYRLAQYYNHQVEIVRFLCLTEDAARACYLRNTHEVPFTTFQSMRQRMAKEEFPGHWKVNLIPLW